MKIAIPVEDNRGFDSEVCEHFGRAPFFAIVTLDGEAKIEIIPSPFTSHGPGEIPKFLSEKGVDVILAMGIGRKAELFFNEFGIKVVRGASGKVGNLIREFLEGNITSVDYKPEGGCH
jgi:predicted Fe-Mo cluster-binding NifX family protein